MPKNQNHKQIAAVIASSILLVGMLVGVVTPPPARPSTGPAPPATSPVAPLSGLGSLGDAMQRPRNAAVAASAVSKPAVPQPATAAPSDVPARHFPGLPDYPHPQYEYQALVTTPDSPASLASTEPFWSRVAAAAGQAAVVSGNPAPTIAVIDTGFALNHEDLINRWATNPNEEGSTGTEGAAPNCTTQSLTPDKSCNNIDNDGNGYASDWRGWDFIDNTNNPLAGKTDPNGSGVFHGTMTAGLAALMDPQAKIMPLQALSDEGVGYTDEIAAAVRYAADNGASVISLSLGSSSDDSYLHQQIDYAIGKGVLVVAAAGNSGCNCLSYPAAYPEVLSVGASDSGDSLAGFSSYGANLDVLAPGTAGDLCSAFYTAGNPTSAYTCSYSGTSFSTPITAGTAALLLQQSPGLSPDDLIRIITQSADKTAAMAGEYRTLQQGYGRIDVAAAVAAASLSPPGGQLLNHTVVSLTAGGSAASSPHMDSTCSGPPGAGCSISLNGPSGQVVGLGTQALDAQYGNADFVWNAASLGLATGQWTVTATLSYQNQTASTSPQSFTIDP